MDPSTTLTKVLHNTPQNPNTNIPLPFKKNEHAPAQ